MKYVRVFGLGIVTSISLLLSSCSESITPEEVKVDAVEEAPPIFPNGVNLQHSYTDHGNVEVGWALMKKYENIKTLRIEINPENNNDAAAQVNNAKRIIQEATAKKYNIIVTYHPNKLGNESTDTEIINAGKFWTNYYNTLSNNNKIKFTINLINEWGAHTIKAGDYAKQVNLALAKVYATSYTGKVIIDAPGYGQETYTLVQALKSITATYRDKLILSAHIYPSCYVYNRPNGKAKGYMTNADLDIMQKNEFKLPCILGEFGSYSKDGGKAEWSNLVAYAKGKGMGWPVIGWAWCGDGTGKPEEKRGINGKGMNMVNVDNEPGKDWSYGNFKLYKDTTPYTASGYMDVIYSRL